MMMWATSPSGAICHRSKTSSEGRSNTTVGEFRCRQALMPCLLNRCTAYSAVLSIPRTVSLHTSSPWWLMAYQSMSGVRPFLEPDSVVSWMPAYSTARPRVSTRCLRVTTTPQGRGAPMSLWPLMEMLLIPAVEPERLWVIHVGQDHSAECGVGVNVVFPDVQLVNDLSDFGMSSTAPRMVVPMVARMMAGRSRWTVSMSRRSS